MKRIIYLLLAILPVCIQSCVKDEEDLFGKSAAERVSEKLQEYNELLEGSVQGWKMEYFPETDQSLGGFTFFCTFKDGEVTMSGDFAFTVGGVQTVPAGTEVKSLYKLIADQGPVLTFDSYNSLFHFFSEPKGMTDTDGYAGDYEFVFMKQEGNRLIMKGKKYGNTMIMTRIDNSSKEELKKILDMQKSLLKLPFRKIDIAGKQYDLDLDLNGRQFVISENGNTVETLGFLFTDQGIRFYEPTLINGENLYEFTLHPQTKAFTAINAKASILRTPWIEILTHPTTIYIFDFNVEKNIASMNAEFYDLIKTAYETDKSKERELFLILYIGKNHLENASGETCIAFGSVAGSTFYYPSYGCQFIASGDNNDLLNINIDYSKNNMMGYYSFFKPIADYIGQHSPYRLEDVDTNSTNSVKCISVNDPTVWFELQ